MVHPSMSNEELLEAVEAIERQQQQKVECYDDDLFEFSDEFVDLVKRMEERGDKEKEEEPVAIQPDSVSPELLLFSSFLFFLFPPRTVLSKWINRGVELAIIPWRRQVGDMLKHLRLWGWTIVYKWKIWMWGD